MKIKTGYIMTAQGQKRSLKQVYRPVSVVSFFFHGTTRQDRVRARLDELTTEQQYSSPDKPIKFAFVTSDGHTIFENDRRWFLLPKDDDTAFQLNAKGGLVPYGNDLPPQFDLDIYDDLKGHTPDALLVKVEHDGKDGYLQFRKHFDVYSGITFLPDNQLKELEQRIKKNDIRMVSMPVYMFIEDAYTIENNQYVVVSRDNYNRDDVRIHVGRLDNMQEAEITKSYEQDGFNYIETTQGRLKTCRSTGAHWWDEKYMLPTSANALGERLGNIGGVQGLHYFLGG